MDAPATDTRIAPVVRGVEAINDAGVLASLRLRLIRGSIRKALASARFRVALVVGLTLVLWFGLYFLLRYAFAFVAHMIGAEGPLHLQVVRFTFDIFFGSLMVMLIFSAGIILYGGLFRSEETVYLLTRPIRAETIVLHKFQEAVVFSSWGFLLLGSPMLVAYGQQSGAPWLYFAMLPLFLLCFALIPCSVGALGCLLIVYWAPRFRATVLVVALLATVIVAGIAIGPILFSNDVHALDDRWIRDTITRLRFGSFNFLPSWWLSSGLLNLAHSAHATNTGAAQAESLRYLALLASNALVGRMAVLFVGGRTLRTSYTRLLTAVAPRRRATNRILDLSAKGLALLMPRRFRPLIVKDMRIFQRDPLQWGQFLIFFCLLALYFLNIRRVSYDPEQLLWLNLISFLNVTVVGLILSTFTTRFIFPMISLEGSRFWILGLLPIDRDTILWGKFLLAAIGSAIPSAILILVSDTMLRIGPTVILLHQLTCLLLSAGLSGLAVGLGASMPNLSEQSPSKIAAGFGGTLNLVLSAVYIVAIVSLTGVPYHFLLMVQPVRDGLPIGAQENFPRLMGAVWIGIGLAVVLGVLTTVIPLRRGLRAFRQMEFY